ncbi:hypothetical protein DNTS_024578 [Danionella cerebrum]|uniref:Uncharacterized protein n=1 Tax=Danionella cerebrum TaxID=2873325 RepID=A0A553NHE6_9TELE|nr:hypothetical protein DNTS_024578 [Danionella translucida]
MMMHEELSDFLNRRRSVSSLRWFLEDTEGPPAARPLTPLQEYLQKLLEMKMCCNNKQRPCVKEPWTQISLSECKQPTSSGHNEQKPLKHHREASLFHNQQNFKTSHDY